MSEHLCLHEEDWGSVKTNILGICRDVKDIKNRKVICPHTKEVARMQVWIYVLWVAVGGMFVWNLKLHGLW